MKIPGPPYEEKKSTMVWKKNYKGGERRGAPPATPTHALNLAHGLYRGSARCTTMWYVIEMHYSNETTTSAARRETRSMV